MIYFVNTYLSPSYVNVCSGKVYNLWQTSTAVYGIGNPINELWHGDMSSVRYVTINNK